MNTIRGAWCANCGTMHENMTNTRILGPSIHDVSDIPRDIWLRLEEVRPTAWIMFTGDGRLILGRGRE